MNKNIIWLGLGLVVGAAGGVFGSRNYFKKKFKEYADSEIEDMKQYYDSLAKKASDAQKEYAGETDNYQNETEEEPKKNLDEIREKLKAGHELTTNYAEQYHIKNRPEEEEKAAKAISEMEETVEISNRNKNRPPRIISAEEASNLDNHISSNVLYYYTENELVVDDDENIVDDPERILGDSLIKYDFINSDETIIFVLNYELDACYEIQKVDGFFQVY